MEVGPIKKKDIWAWGTRILYNVLESFYLITFTFFMINHYLLIYFFTYLPRLVILYLFFYFLLWSTTNIFPKKIIPLHNKSQLNWIKWDWKWDQSQSLKWDLRVQNFVTQWIQPNQIKPKKNSYLKIFLKFVLKRKNLIFYRKIKITCI